MRELAIVAMVAIIALVSLVFVGGVANSGAFVTRPTVRIISTMEYETQYANVCEGTKAYCQAPSCPTGLTRVIMPGDIPRLQWMSIPTTLVGKQLGGCCEQGTSLTFQVQEDQKQQSMQLTCNRGRWSASFA